MKAYLEFDWDIEYGFWACEVSPQFDTLDGDLIFADWEQFIVWRKKNYHNFKDFNTCFIRVVVG